MTKKQKKEWFASAIIGVTIKANDNSKHSIHIGTPLMEVAAYFVANTNSNDEISIGYRDLVEKLNRSYAMISRAIMLLKNIGALEVVKEGSRGGPSLYKLIDIDNQPSDIFII